jgi:hypothetical protein
MRNVSRLATNGGAASGRGSLQRAAVNARNPGRAGGSASVGSVAFDADQYRFQPLLIRRCPTPGRL